MRIVPGSPVRPSGDVIRRVGSTPSARAARRRTSADAIIASRDEQRARSCEDRRRLRVVDEVAGARGLQQLTVSRRSSPR